MLLEYTTLLHCCNPRFTHHHHGVICSNICQLPAPLLIRYLIFISKNVIPYYGCGWVSTHTVGLQFMVVPRPQFLFAFVSLDCLLTLNCSFCMEGLLGHTRLSIIARFLAHTGSLALAGLIALAGLLCRTGLLDHARLRRSLTLDCSLPLDCWLTLDCLLKIACSWLLAHDCLLACIGLLEH